MAPPLAYQAPSDILCGDITSEDLDALLTHLPARSAPGPSQVSYCFLKHAPASAKTLLLAGLNALLQPEGYTRSPHTEYLKQAFITLLVKDPAKSLDSMNNLRPISLLDSIKRLVGRIITDRLQKAAEAQGVYSDLQFGFRAHHSTKMAIARIHATFNEARHRRGKLMVAYLDFANMYCTIPHALIR